MAQLSGASGRGFVGSADQSMTTSYPSPVPDDFHGAVDPSLRSGTPLSFHDYHPHIPTMSSAHACPHVTTPEHSYAWGPDVAPLPFCLGPNQASSLSQLLSPDRTIMQSPSIASEGLYDSVADPPVDSADVMFSSMGAVDNHSSHHQHMGACPRSHDCVDLVGVSSFQPGVCPVSVAFVGSDLQQSLFLDNEYQGDIIGHGPMGPHSISTAGITPAINLTLGAQQQPHPASTFTTALHYGRPEAGLSSGLEGQSLTPATGSESLYGQRLPHLLRASPERSVKRPKYNPPRKSESKSEERQHFYPCLFQVAGCGSGFLTKNEWKRHINTIHVRAELWICDKGKCASSSIACHHQDAFRRVPKFPCLGRIFTRRDLYVSHLKRSHKDLMPGDYEYNKGQLSKQLEDMADEACHRRICLPTDMACSVDGCSESFYGSSAWDDFLEHIADHLKKAPPGTVAILSGQECAPLMRWAVAAGFVEQTKRGWLQRPAVANYQPSKKRPGPNNKRRYDEVEE